MVYQIKETLEQKMPDLAKGQNAPLNVTQEAQHRIYVGLGWDPHKPGFIGKARDIVEGKKPQHDLDLSCFMYDEQKSFVSMVTAETERAIDESGAVYHSGDSQDGLGGGDDEQISVELKNIPGNIHHIVFKVIVKSGHTFGEIESAEIRLVDGYSDHVFLETGLGGLSGKDKSAFVFVRVYKKEGIWHVQNISDFIAMGKMSDWTASMKKYLLND